MDNDILNKATWIVNGIAAANWGATEALDTNLVTDTLGLAAGDAGMVYLAIGVSGLVGLYQFAQMYMD